MDRTEKPALFIGSSSEGLEVARAVEYQLQGVAEVTVWDEGAFTLGYGNLDNLVKILERFAFAILVLTPDDLVLSVDRLALTPRDNVMFELGLFMGRLGRDRTFIVCSDHDDMRLPTDLSGVSVARYASSRIDGNLIAAVGPPCTQIRAILGRLEPAPSALDPKTRSDAFAAPQGVEHVIGILARTRIAEMNALMNMVSPGLRSKYIDEVRSQLGDLTDEDESDDSKDSSNSSTD